MNKKIFSTITVLIGVLALMGAGCSLKSLVKDKKPEVTNPSAACEAGKEITAPNAQVKELKTILNEAGCDVRLTEETKLDSPNNGTLVFVWKNEPKPAKLEAAFKKHGYKVEVTDAFITAQKGNISLSISLADDVRCKKISVSITDKTPKPGKGVTEAECVELAAYARYSSYQLVTKKDVFTSMIWSRKLFDGITAYAIKYGSTFDGISADCKAMTKEAGFMDKVDIEMKDLGISDK